VSTGPAGIARGPATPKPLEDGDGPTTGVGALPWTDTQAPSDHAVGSLLAMLDGGGAIPKHTEGLTQLGPTGSSLPRPGVAPAPNRAARAVAELVAAAGASLSGASGSSNSLLAALASTFMLAFALAGWKRVCPQTLQFALRSYAPLLPPG
jgi:hypothetical protein